MLELVILIPIQGSINQEAKTIVKSMNLIILPQSEESKNDGTKRRNRKIHDHVCERLLSEKCMNQAQYGQEIWTVSLTNLN